MMCLTYGLSGNSTATNVSIQYGSDGERSHLITRGQSISKQVEVVLSCRNAQDVKYIRELLIETVLRKACFPTALQYLTETLMTGASAVRNHCSRIIAAAGAHWAFMLRAFLLHDRTTTLQKRLIEYFFLQ